MNLAAAAPVVVPRSSFLVTRKPEAMPGSLTQVLKQMMVMPASLAFFERGHRTVGRDRRDQDGFHPAGDIVVDHAAFLGQVVLGVAQDQLGAGFVGRGLHAGLHGLHEGVALEHDTGDGHFLTGGGSGWLRWRRCGGGLLGRLGRGRSRSRRASAQEQRQDYEYRSELKQSTGLHGILLG